MVNPVRNGWTVWRVFI